MSLLLKYRNFRWILGAHGASRLADSLESLVFAWLVYQLTGSALLMGTIFAVNALPNILLAPWAGVLADRWRKLPLVRLATAGRLLVAVSLLLGVMTGMIQVWMLFVLTVASSTFETLGGPAQSALVRHLVDERDLADAAGLNSSATASAQMVGLALAAVLVGPVGMTAALAVVVLFFALALSALTQPRILTDQRAAALPDQSSPGEFTAGFRFIVRDRVILVVVALALLVNLFFTPLTVLETPLVKEVLGGGPELLAALGLCLLAGMLGAGFLVGRVVARWGTWNTLLLGLLGLGGSIGGLGWVAQVGAGTDLASIASLPLYVLSGVAVTFANASISSWAQAKIPPEVQGRVFAVVGALGMAATPLGAAASGALAEQWSLAGLFLTSGGLVLLVSVTGRWLLGRWDRGPADAEARALLP